MLHATTTLLMLAQVLACPYFGCEQCQGTAPSELIAAENCEAGCKCPVDTDLPCNEQCPGDCGACECFCCGAIQPDIVECPDLICGGLTHLLPVTTLCLGDRTEVLRTSDAVVMDCSPHFPPRISAASLRAIAQSFLL